jgi:hypothetical protein
LTSTSDFESALRNAERELREAKTADDVRRIWRANFQTLGHRTLGRLLTGLSARELLDRRKEREED